MDFKSKIHTTITVNFEGVQGDDASKNPYLYNVTDGTFGLAPYTADLRDKELNLLYQLKKSNKISYMVFSIYSLFNGATHLKLGGYDELGAMGNVTGNSNFSFIKTASQDSWKLSLVQAWTFGILNEIPLTSSKFAIPEVAYPYVYIPVGEFNSTADHLNEFF